MKKTIKLFSAALLFLLCLSSCSSSVPKANESVLESSEASPKLINEFDPKTNKKVSVGDYTIEIPSTWQEYDGNYFTNYGSDNFNMIVLKTVPDQPLFSPDFMEEKKDQIVKTFFETIDQNYELSNVETKQINDVFVLTARGKLITSEIPFCVDACFFSNVTDTTLISVLLADNLNNDDDYSSDFSKIINTISLKENVEKMSEQTKTTETEEVKTNKEEVNEKQETEAAVVGSTLGEQNALKTAQSYLKYSSFSYSGLIKQLEYEGYSTEEATFAVDHVGADWSEQALLSAQSYLKYSSFSYSGLVKQLEYEGFSNEEAVYGVDHSDADWYEQAVKTAESYLKYSSFSRSGLYDQLIYEGFSEDQAEHALSEVGY